MDTFDSKRLKRWFASAQRDLPWRENRTPYAVWVSEMMLQQTQVSVVIPYFERWMVRFPTIQHLADASLDEVIKIWEGLGYYSRARYLHQGARMIVEQYGGIFPESEEDLSKIKGLGAYTVGAIRSFAFRQRAAAVDGNVLRVLARYFQIEEDISKPKTVQHIRALAFDILPEQEPWIVSEALIELGATICTRQPKCGSCPLQMSCQGYASGKATQLPVKSARVQTEVLHRAVALISWKDRWLVRRGQPGEVMSDLHEFPYFETTAKSLSAQQLKKKIEKEFGFAAEFEEAHPLIKHGFTRFLVRLYPQQFVCMAKKQPVVNAPYQWRSVEELQQLAFSSGHRRLFGLLQM